MVLLQYIRSFLFEAILYVFMAIYLILSVFFMIFCSESFRFRILYGLSYSILFFLKKIVKIDYQIEGYSNLEQIFKQGPFLIASKHQSAWETVAFPFLLRHNFTIILKKELKYIPFFGFFLHRLKMIFIDRQANRKSVRNMLIQARQAVQCGKSVLIFPEGTRVLPKEHKAYQSGVGLLYNDLNIPVIPVALNSGLFWERRSFFKKSGCIIIKFLPPIFPGLKREEFMLQLENSIQTACKNLNS